ncbi:hypothetical protein [Marinobacterium lutimaris]|uniref:Uncharacterized protein n=1 Tax=Marinobacterium lutimaris TaxID=568106 RepID=A0A1H6DW98_9GAMM|nr:hypothetical protein [Marinobacterium lutimaris]SEG89469.1 hypothetical protein SAMN05444390_11224 [Marinobacterium lutimaris]
MTQVLPSLRDTQNVLRIPRLFALDVYDRHHTEQKIGSIMVERIEQYNTAPDGTLRSARIELSYDYIPGTEGIIHHAPFAAEYDADRDIVKLVAGALFMDLHRMEGQRIGTYLMHCIVQWAQQWPSAMVQSIHLDARQGKGENKPRRNRLYEQIGLVFEYDDDTKASGRSLEIPVEALDVVMSWQKNICLKSVPDYLRRINDMGFDLQHKDRVIRQLVEERKQAESAPLRWALKQLWTRHGFSVISALAVSFFALIAWAQH